MKPTIVLSNKLYVPTQHVLPYVYDDFTYKLEEVNKAPCEYCFADTCDGCYVADQDPYVRTYEQWGQWTAFQRGDLIKIWRYFGNDYNIIDQRSRNPFSWPLKFSGRYGFGLSELWENQLLGLNHWWQYRYGIIKAPTRSGKTVLFTALTCLLGYKTILMAHTDDLLKQFLVTFEKFTNVIELRHQYRSPIVGICKDMQQWGSYDVVLTTPHSIYSKTGQRHVSKWRDYFGNAMVDEVHRSPAPCYNWALSNFNTLHRVGCTATELRKDGGEVIMFDSLGPIITEIESNQLKCDVHVWETGVFIPKFKIWNTFIKRLTEDGNRNQFIVEKIMERVQEGHSVVAVTTRRAHIDLLVRVLDNAGIVAAPFYDGVNRDFVLEGAKDGSIQVVIAMRQLVAAGINVPRWSNIHTLVPIGFRENAHQEMSRCRTRPLLEDGIRDGLGFLKVGNDLGGPGELPVIDYYFDNGGPSWPLYQVANKFWKDPEQDFEVVWHKYGESSQPTNSPTKGRTRI